STSPDDGDAIRSSCFECLPRVSSQMLASLTTLPDGRLASASTEDVIRLWDLKAGTETTRLMGHRGAVAALAALPDGRLASGSADNSVRLWDLKAEAEYARLMGHTAAVAALAALPDGRLASSSYDNSI